MPRTEPEADFARVDAFFFVPPLLLPPPPAAAPAAGGPEVPSVLHAILSCTGHPLGSGAFANLATTASIVPAFAF